MALISSDERICGKCGIIFQEAFNMGMLECTDIFYSDDKKLKLVYASDHREMSIRGARERTTLNWQDWVWTFDDNIHIQSSIFKKLPRQPKHQAIVDIDKYNYLLAKHEKKIIESENKISGSSSSKMVYEPESDEDFSYESLDDDDILEQDMASAFAYDFGPIKQVCIARFDWEKKFSVISMIKDHDDNELIKKKTAGKDVVYYWNTEEYKNNPDKRLAFKRKLSESPFT